MPENHLLGGLENVDDDDFLEIDESSSQFSKLKRPRLAFPFGSCRVCSDSATGIHYGIATCEGCKGFFKRSILRKEKYRCYFDNKCVINITNRNRCKSCRFRRCITEGMSVDGVKMGRIPKLVKERALRELREQQMKKKATLADGHGRESTCSSLSDRSIENYDPNRIETESVESNFYENEKSTIDEQNFEKNFFLENFFDEFSFIDQEIVRRIETIDDFESKLDQSQSETIDFIRKFNFELFRRNSNFSEKLFFRMRKLINNRTEHFPGENLTTEQFSNSIRLSAPFYIRSIVVHVRQIPGIETFSFDEIQQIISQRFFDVFLLKFFQFFHKNGQCFLLTVDGLQLTRRRLNFFIGNCLTDEIFDFSAKLQNLNLNEQQISLTIAYRIFANDSIRNKKFESFRFAYRRALRTEFSSQFNENQAKLMCNKIDELLDLLTSISAIYQRDVGSKLLQV